MSDITAKLVNELRTKTGLGMMECKKALTETCGDIEKAVDYFRKKGVKTSITQRAANEGRVAVSVAPDGKSGVIVEINCNTDFTAKSEPIVAAINGAVQKLLADPTANLAEDPKLKEQLVQVSQQTGENVQIGRTAVLTAGAGKVGSYLYSTGGKGKIAVLVAVAGNTDDDVVRNLSMHIVASKPLALTRQQVPAEVVAREKDIAVEQAKASGKPQNIAEKIAEGKLQSFFAERVLLDQEFINPEVFKGPVSAFLKGKGTTLEKFIRVEVGLQS